MSVAALLFFVRALSLTLSLWLVAGWSAAEAAIFFIVADVPISWIAVRKGAKAAMLAAVVAALASLVGGFAVYWWTAHDPAGQSVLYASLPGIDAGLIGEAADHYRHGPYAVLAGSFQGIPYKLFAVEAATEHSWLFLLLTPLLRLPRFLLVAAGVGALSKFLARWLDERARLALLILCWTLFYAWYWSAMAG